LEPQHAGSPEVADQGAATTVVTQRNEDPIYTRCERLVDGGTRPTLAKLSLARMIAATVLRMWKSGEAYDPGRSRPSTSTHEGQGRRRSGESPGGLPPVVVALPASVPALPR